MAEFLEFLLHAENHLREFISLYGAWVYLLLFMIIFLETGVVVTPFLPGDSLLFAVGMLAAQGLMDINFLTVLLLIAAILGDTVNYWVGRWVGPKVFSQEKGLWFRKEYLLRAHAFYEKHGGKAIVLARFVPIIRTFAPFVAGIGYMDYRKFLFYNVLGAVLWVCGFLWAGYWLGNVPVVKNNMKLVVLIIIVASVLPIVWEWWKHRQERAAAPAQQPAVE